MIKSNESLVLVASIAVVNSFLQASGKPERSPILLKRILFSSSSEISFAIVSTIKFIKPSTSSLGLFQFSVEKAYNVRCLTPNSTQAFRSEERRVGKECRFWMSQEL